jgi:hypothetical protein
VTGCGQIDGAALIECGTGHPLDREPAHGLGGTAWAAVLDSYLLGHLAILIRATVTAGGTSFGKFNEPTPA